MPNEAEGSLDKRTYGIESAAQVLLGKSGPYDLTKSEAASTIFKSFANSFAFSRKILSDIIRFFDNACLTQIENASSSKGYFTSQCL